LSKQSIILFLSSWVVFLNCEDITRNVAAMITWNDSFLEYVEITVSIVRRIYSGDIFVSSFVEMRVIWFIMACFVGGRPWSSGTADLNVPSNFLKTFNGRVIGVCFSTLGNGKFNEVDNLVLIR